LTTLQSKGFAEAVGLETAALWNEISITPTPGQHGRGEILIKTGSVMGFFMRAAGEPTVYLAGDTVLTADVLEVIRNGKPDVIVTHSGGANIGGDLIIMDDSETIELFRNARNAIVVAVHMEALDHCPVTRLQLREAADAAHIPEHRLLIPADGQGLALWSSAL
jgi:L-ascorbate metabolism protein UlaG (beta-lactamase superfamily)